MAKAKHGMHSSGAISDTLQIALAVLAAIDTLPDLPAGLTRADVEAALRNVLHNA